MKISTLSPILLAALCATALPSCHKKEKAVEQQTPRISVAVPETDSIVLHKTYPGLILTTAKARVMGQVNGTILTKTIKGGTYVKKGQVLYTIDPTTYLDALHQAEASLSTAQAQKEYYSRQYEAMEKAFKSDAVSQMDVAQAKSNLQQSEASVKTAQAALSTARFNLDNCTVRATADGWIDSGDLDPGNYIAGQASPVQLATIINNDVLVAQFAIEDSQYEKMVGRNGGIAGKLYRDMPLKFAEQMLHEYSADLDYVGPDVDSNTGTLILKGVVHNTWHELKDGMYVTVSLPYGTRPHAILVKDASIGTDQLGNYLYTVNDSNIVRQTRVELGETYRDSLRIVESGLAPGTRYVTKALLTVRPGMKIDPQLTK